uniref:DMA domain-containing protein n=1 Tax=Anopheles dirus TaxID=7168 RepID=A0A182N5C5_9DIPT
VALKRQQAVEDAIALRLASTETGTQLETLPPGKIYGMTVTEPCPSPSPSSSAASVDVTSSTSSDGLGGSFEPAEDIPMGRPVATGNVTVSQNALDMLAKLFPHRKRSVLELILKRCDSDLLKAIEQCSQTQTTSAFKPPAATASPVPVPSTSSPMSQPPVSPSGYSPFIAYPKWLLPMSIPVSFSHIAPNLAPRCTLPNCVMCVHHPL